MINTEAGELDSLDEALMQRYGLPRSGQNNSTAMTSISVGQEHYRSFSPLSGEYCKKMAEMCCDREKMLWCTR